MKWVACGEEAQGSAVWDARQGIPYETDFATTRRRPDRRSSFRPNGSPAKRVPFGEEPQGSVAKFSLGGNGAWRTLRRRKPADFVQIINAANQE